MNQKELADAIKRGAEEALSQSGLLSAKRKALWGGTRSARGTRSSDYDTDPDAGYKSFGEFLHDVKRNPLDPRLKQLSEGSDPAGGFLVPEQFRNQIMMESLEQSVIRPNATIIPMTSDTLNIPAVLDTTHTEAGGVMGGVIAYWLQEAGTKLHTEPEFRQIKLIAKKLIGFTYASDELLEDSAIALEALLIQIFSQAIAWYEDEAFIDGSGVGEPLGFMNSGSLISVTRTPTTATIVLADLAGMYARLLPQSASRAVWLANPSCLVQLLQLATTSLSWLPLSGGLVEAPPARLLGRPIYFTEKMQTLGTKGDIALCDLSKYIIGDRTTGIRVDTSQAYRFSTDETTWRFVKRVDGQPWSDEVFTPKHGETLSPFVVLTTATA